ncbi:FecR family protein [Zhouia sp. PK063]|uniref:FecR family protein n=1 Tax=Zhouia sp. PK063 TaxID=3373602 RepID=UPI0037927AC3
MTNKELITLAEKYAANTCTKEEAKIVEHFFDELQHNKITHIFTKEEHLRLKMLYNIRKSIHQPILKYNWTRFAAKIAAVLIFGLGIFATLQQLKSNKQQTLITTIALNGEKKDVVLADGTTVTLNSGSSLTYPSTFDSIRKVTLSGEAFFKVFHDNKHPFVIKSGKINTRVLGTSFNIQAYPKKDISVSVRTGKVRVSEAENFKNHVILIKNQQTVFDSIAKAFTVRSKNTTNAIAWTKNIIVLQNNTLKETAEILERWYNVKISFEDKLTEDYTISGKFRNEKLDNILKSIKYLKPINYQFTTQNQIIIRTEKNK